MITQRITFAAAAAIAATVAAPYSASAQSNGDDFVAMLEALANSSSPPKFVSIQGIGSGTVAPGGTVFGSVSGATERASGSGADGSLAFGAGFGDADEGIGAQLTANITSVDPNDFGDSGYFGLKFGKAVGSEVPTYVSLRIDNLASWGDSAENDVTASAAVTSFGRIAGGGSEFPTMLTIGIEAVEGGSASAFGGIGIGLSEHFGASLSHDGENVNVGLGFKVSGVEGLSGSVTLDDAFEQDGDRRATFSLSYSLPKAF